MSQQTLTATISSTLVLMERSSFAHSYKYKGEGDYGVSYNLFDRGGSRIILYVRREIKHGRKVRGKENDLSLFIGNFNLIDAANKVRVVNWNYGLDEDMLVWLLAAPKGAKKRKL